VEAAVEELKSLGALERSNETLTDLGKVCVCVCERERRGGAVVGGGRERDALALSVALSAAFSP
jgi:hypothetical protein